MEQKNENKSHTTKSEVRESGLVESILTKNGVLKKEIYYDKDNQIIKEKTFFKNGELESISLYENSKMTKRSFFHENGGDKSLELWDKGIITDERGWYDNGDLKYNKKYENNQCIHDACYSIGEDISKI